MVFTTPLPDPLSMAAGVTATAIALGGDHTCAIQAGGGVKCWGKNDNGQLGIGSTDSHTRPQDVTGGSRGGPTTARAMEAFVGMGVYVV